MNWREDRGSSVIEFALVAPLILVIAVGVLQVVLALHVRSTLTAAAAEGARAGALAGSSTLVAERRTREVLSDALGGDAAESVKVQRIRLDGVPVVRVSVSGRLPLIGLLGPSTLTVDGHAMQEIP
ncbi:MAG: pilus assembly protein [Actinobacteria bacterium]|nr:pilus assembly protein [Actinomycetota bacterium]